ncbi:MAG: hypothetical protein ABW133_09720, partial [Polyangiaceae bacterium]
ADPATLRTKLRAQIGKLDSLNAETNGVMKEQAPAPQSDTLDVDAWLRALVERTAVQTPAKWVLPASARIEVAVDRKLLDLATSDVVAVLAEHAATRDGSGTPMITVTVDEPDPGQIRVRLGDLEAPYALSLAKAPFAIAGGGIRLAVARAMTQNAGGMLRLEHGEGDKAAFAVFLKRPE